MPQAVIVNNNFPPGNYPHGLIAGNMQEESVKKKHIVQRFDLLRNWLILHPNEPLYLSLLTQNSSSAFKECEAKCYSRVEIFFGIDGKTRCYNINKAGFPTAQVNWGTFYYLGLYEKMKGGNLIYLEKIQGSPITIEAGTTVIFPAGEGVKKMSKSGGNKTGLVIGFGNNGICQNPKTFYKQIL